MKWFGRKAARETGRPFLLRYAQGMAGGGDFPRSYEAQVRAAYIANPVAQRTVRLVAEAVGAASVFAAEGPAAAAVLLPACRLETIATQLLLHGTRRPGSIA